MDTLLIGIIVLLLVIVVPILFLRASRQPIAVSEPQPEAGHSSETRLVAEGSSEPQPAHANGDEQLRGGHDNSDAASAVAMVAGTALIARAASTADADDGAADGDTAADADGDGGPGQM